MANEFGQDRQAADGPSKSDMGSPGGSSSGGRDPIADNMREEDLQGIDDELGDRASPGQSRGEAFDEAQGGGRDDQSVSDEGLDESEPGTTFDEN